MVDITLCNNYTCTEKDRCYRYWARPSRYQSYGPFQGGPNCPYFVLYSRGRDGKRRKRVATP